MANTKGNNPVVMIGNPAEKTEAEKLPWNGETPTLSVGGINQNQQNDQAAAAGQAITNSQAGATRVTGGERDQMATRLGVDFNNLGDVQRQRKEGTSGADESFMSDEDYALSRAVKAEWINNDKLYQEAMAAGDYSLAEQYQQRNKELNLFNERLRMGYGYVGGADGSGHYTLDQAGITLPNQTAQQNTGGYRSASGGTGRNTAGSTVSSVDSDLRNMLSQWQQAALAQSNGQVDYAVAKAVADLERALEDAQPQFKEQAESVDRNARQAMDNAALYAEMRGDRGGIGQEQYNSIQNTAAQNHLSVQQAQTKLATDTQRQIADLRAQGEFEKADAALSITQEYLAKLVSLEQWAAEYNMSVEQFNAQLSQWEKEYQLSLQQMQISQNQWEKEFGLALEQFNVSKNQWQQAFDAENNRWEQEFGFNKEQQQIANDQWQQAFDAENNRWREEMDYSKLTDEQKQAIAIGEAMLSEGVIPSDEQLAAMGMTREQAQAYIDELARQEQADKDYSQMTAAHQQAIAIGEAMLSEGVIPSDEQLAAMGMTREQAQAYIDELARQEQADKDYSQMTAARKQAAAMGEILLSAGIMPSEEQLAAMGMTRSQAQSYITAILTETSESDESPAYKDIVTAAKRIGDPKKTDAWLGKMVEEGWITIEEADYIYSVVLGYSYISPSKNPASFTTPSMN